MKFNYELKINGRGASLTMDAPSMEDVITAYYPIGRDSDWHNLGRKVDWSKTVSEVVNRLNEIHFCTIVSSSIEDEPKTPKVSTKSKRSSEED